ncbi:MAG: NAD(P)H-hydrate epimerase [Planctomycetia bacterium]|nr:NAD(P)H-hydrate epimerase [Planctomycetia bacterium]
MRSLHRDEVRDVDRRAIEEYGLPGIVLMENAGRNAAALLHDLAGAAETTLPVAVVCGKGNNGGDGFVIARHLENLGHPVVVLVAAARDAATGDAAINQRVVQRAGQPIAWLESADQACWERSLAGAGWIVDALLGTGTTGPARGPMALAIDAINATRSRGGTRVFAVDLPSGLDCDTGLPAGPCVRADVTGTFVARKAGFDRPGAAAYTGAVHVLDIGAPKALLHDVGCR